MTVERLPTLPDYLRHGLEIVFVGINPGAYSARVGHYFAAPRNRFWTALNGSGIARAGRDLGPVDDMCINDYGIGLTDVVKRASNSASNLRAKDYRQWTPVLREKLLEYRPLVVCFNGLVGYKNYLQYCEGSKCNSRLGLQERVIGDSRVFVVPSSSPANAAFSLYALVSWYRLLGEFRDDLKAGTCG